MTRGKGEDSIYQRASDGRWVGAVEVGLCVGGHRKRDGSVCPGGERRRTHVVRRSKADVVAAIKELRDRVDAGATTNRNWSVATYLDYWLTDVCDVTEGSSRDEYAKRLTRIKDRIGKLQLVKLSKTDVQRLARQLSDAYAPKTRQTTMATFRQALEWAVPEYLPRNPAANVRSPKHNAAKTDDALNVEQARALLAQAEGDRYYALYWLALKYGLRIGELIGLRWSHISDSEMTVVRSSTKTDAGYRTLPLIDEAVSVLDAHRARWVDPDAMSYRGRRTDLGVELAPTNVVPLRSFGQGPDDPVFPAPEGGQLKPQRVRLWFSDLCERAGIDHLCRNCGTDRPCSSNVRRFHCSRHTAATLLLEAGVELEVVSAILGHSSIKITADIYAKVRNDLKRKGLKKLG